MVVDVLVFKLCVIGIIDGLNIMDEVVFVYVCNFGFKCFYMVDLGVCMWDIVVNVEVDVLVFVYVVGLFVYIDVEYGYWVLLFNKEFVGIIGIGWFIEFFDNDFMCCVNLFNEVCIVIIICDGGYCLWGNCMLLVDLKWLFVMCVCMFDIFMDVVQVGYKWVVDCGIIKMYVYDVIEGLQVFMCDQCNVGVFINFEVYVDLVLNIVSWIEQGSVVWNVCFIDVIFVENLIFCFEVINEWLIEVFDIK